VRDFVRFTFFGLRSDQHLQSFNLQLWVAIVSSLCNSYMEIRICF